MVNVLAAMLVLAAGGEALTAGSVQLVADGFKFTEGPVWMPDGYFVFSDIPANTIYKDDKSVFRRPSGKSNGLSLDNQGRLVACEHWNRRVTRTAEDGSITVLADQYQGKKFNSPNDLAIRSDGAIFFTDPPYGLEDREAELDFSGVFMVVPGEEPKLLFKEWERPNGLAFSPDEKTLYIGDSQAGIIHAFDAAKDGTLSNGRLFAETPGPDGMKVDKQGRLWTTASDGVRVYAPDGVLVGTIEFPRKPANCAFGGENGRTLFVTARDSVFQVAIAAEGILPGK